MNAKSIFGTARELAGKTGLHPIYPDKITITPSELERLTLDEFEDYGLDRWIGEDAMRELARNVACYVRRQFVRWVPYTSAIDTEAPARPNAVEGSARERLIWSFARTLHSRGLTHVEATACCISLNESRCMPPLRDAEVAAIVSRAERPRAVA